MGNMPPARHMMAFSGKVRLRSLKPRWEAVAAAPAHGTRGDRVFEEHFGVDERDAVRLHD